jgi:hypothetical protein
MTCDSNLPKVQLDHKGRVASVEYSHAQKQRQFAYDGDSDEIVRVVVKDEKDGTVRVFIKQYGSLWIVCNEVGKKLGEWRGTVRVEPDGTYCVQSERRSGHVKTARFFA